jgi:prepilin peptidase CpaA
VVSFPVAHLAAATLLLVAAAASDAWKRRVPNALSGAMAVAGAWTQASERGWMAMFSGLAAATVMIALLWRPWLKGRIGGGDVKMGAATAIWLGLLALPQYVLVSAVAGGIVAAAAYLASSRQARGEMRANLKGAAAAGVVPEVPLRGGAGRVSVPYSVAFAMGALVILWGGRWW